MYDLKEELRYIILKTHEMLDIWANPRAVTLLLGTAATESNFGQVLRQEGYSMQSDKGAFGLYQMELNTHDDLWDNFLNYRSILCTKVKMILGCLHCREALIGNLYYATAMARLQYLRHKEPLPPVDDLQKQGTYYCKYFNSNKGKGTVEKYVADYKRFVL
jgi:hypothetical protein